MRSDPLMNFKPTHKMPKTGLEPITVSYKETVLPIKLFRLKLAAKFYPKILHLPNYYNK